MHKIIIITCKYDRYTDVDYQSSKRFIDSVSNWQEVSDEDYEMLVQSARYFGFIVIDRIKEDPKEIQKTVTDWIAYLNECKAKDERIKQERSEKAKKNKEKRELRLLEQLKKQYEKPLQEKQQ